MTVRTLLVAVALLGTAGAAHAQTGKKNLSDYLVDLSAGPVAAGDLVGLAASAVATLETPKDLLLALGSGQSDTAKAGQGVAITPARTDLVPLAIADYADPSNVMTRLWGGTSFSYAQNKLKARGAEYDQNAAAVQVSYYLKPSEDPLVAAYESFKACEPLYRGSFSLGDAVNAELGRANREMQLREGRDLNVREIEAVRKRMLADDAFKKWEASLPELRKTCVTDVMSKAQKQWNANRIAISFGTGRIKPSVGGNDRSLGRFVALAAALRARDQGLVQVSWRRAEDQPDVATLASTTVTTKSSELAAIRYTYGVGGDLFALAEVSNASQRNAGVSAGAFKYALGVDKKLYEGVWLEFRLGKSRLADGSGEQTTGLFNLKFSTQSTLPKLPQPGT